MRELTSDQLDEEPLSVPPPLSGLLPRGGLRRGCVIAVEQSGLLCMTLAAGASAAGGWCAAVGMPELGMLAAADAGVDLDRLLLVPDPGQRWPHVVAALLDGCELVLLRPPDRPSAQVKRRLAAHARRSRCALVVDLQDRPTGIRSAELAAKGQERTRVGSSGGTPPRVLVVWCPDWPVVVAAAAGAVTTAAGMVGAPVAVVAADHIVACSAAARAAGVRRGQRLRDAQRHCPALIVHARGVDAEARAFESVVTTVEAFCPRVEVLRPGTCAIGARGPARYFGGEDALVYKIRQAMADRGFACRIGVADGVFAAQLAARSHQPGVVVQPGETPRFLAPHPARLLDYPELTGLLARLGIHTIGDFAALSADDVLARFGSDGVTAHRLARGLEPRPLAPRSPSADLSAAMEWRNGCAGSSTGGAPAHPLARPTSLPVPSVAG